MTVAARHWAHCVCTGSHTAKVLDTPGLRTPGNPTDRQLRLLPGARDSQRMRELKSHGRHHGNSIPIARHRLRGRFSPTGFFAYRTRGDDAPLPTSSAPRPPGKRLSALALHSDPLRNFDPSNSGPQSGRQQGDLDR